MPIRTDSPQVMALRKAVEQKFAAPLLIRDDFVRLSEAIEVETREHIGENTLRRLWGRMKGYASVFARTLNVLCYYVGSASWEAFCSMLETSGKRESDFVDGPDVLKADTLSPGDRVRIGWMPNRLCVIEYLGDRNFRVAEAENSTVRPGDRFSCSTFLKGSPLYVDDLVHGDALYTRFGMGLDNGLTTLERL